MSFKIVRNDITKMNTEAIVNTASATANVGPGCDSAIHAAAGFDKLLSYRMQYFGYVPEGEVFITPGFKLKAKYIIHAVSPQFTGGNNGEEEKLRSCYRKSLKIAKENGIRSIAFPLIATGGFAYPKEEGMRIAVDEINAFLLENDMDIFLVVFDTKSTLLGEKLYPALEAYIDHNYVKDKREEEYGDAHFNSVRPTDASYDRYMESARQLERRTMPNYSMPSPQATPPCPAPAPQVPTPYHGAMPPCPAPDRIPMPIQEPGCQNFQSSGPGAPGPEFHRVPAEEQKKPFFGGSIFKKKTSQRDIGDALQYTDNAIQPMQEEALEEIEVLEQKLNERLKHRSDTYSQYLLYLIQSKGLDNADVYKKAVVDKKTFSKIKNNPDYHPKKLTALCLCVGARLNLDETRDLLARAGYALSPCDMTDIIFSFFIEQKHFDILDIAIQLEEHGLEPLFE
ncbi:MAG: macro domain-containing protein [Lachnospiraceae bacterium]|nr:macro domain-containing protein [Lachnospiraceae bacterium]